jgi:formate dehydrogenase/NADH-quinone oxidoreductase subunit F
MVIAELHKIQKQHGYIPEKDLYELSARTNIPVYDLHGVASFYPGFRMTPPPRVEVLVCGDFPCHLKGCSKLRKQIEDIAGGHDDVKVGHVSCLGQCDRGPAITINEKVYAGKPADQVLSLVKLAMDGMPVEEMHFPGLKGPFMCDPYKTEAERYGAVKELAKSGDAAGVIKKLKDAGLRGMGGAGFPTGVKWEAVKNCPGEQKYIVCNADECEVGTFKDRELMKNVPHLLVEGMVLAGLVTGANHGYIYIRHEYHDQIHTMEHEIEKARKLGIVGENAAGSGKKYELEVFVSPGGYIQGEESALLEAIEGHRGQPRVKPPFPVFVGLWGKPTVINNVETLSYTPAIIMKGPEAWKALGKQTTTVIEYEKDEKGNPKLDKWQLKPGGPVSGVKWIGVSGHVNNPGVFEVPMGTTYEEAIYKLAGGISGGKKLKAFAPSGPSGGYLPASMVGLSMDFGIMGNVKFRGGFGSMLGSGAIVAMAEGTDMVELALNAVRFFRNESCGKCVPCRVGSQKMVDTIFAIMDGRGTKEDIAHIDQLSDALLMTSICGLGQVVPAPILSTLEFFRNEIDQRIDKTRMMTQTK